MLLLNNNFDYAQIKEEFGNSPVNVRCNINIFRDIRIERSFPSQIHLIEFLAASTNCEPKGPVGKVFYYLFGTAVKMLTAHNIMG